MFEVPLRRSNDNHHDRFLDFCQSRWPLVRTDQFDGEHGFIRFNILVFLNQPHSHRPRRFRLWCHLGKRIALGSKPSLLTRIVRTSLETRLFLNVIHLGNINKHVPLFALGWFSNRTRTWLDDGKARKGLNTTSGAQFATLSLVKQVVWFARAVVNWRSRSVAKSAYWMAHAPFLNTVDHWKKKNYQQVAAWERGSKFTNH